MSDQVTWIITLVVVAALAGLVFWLIRSGNWAKFVTFLGEVRTEMVMPGDNVNLEVELIAPIAMEKGVRFAIREGGRTVGAGTVTEIVK